MGTTAASWLDPSSSSNSTSSQDLSLDSALSSDLASALTNEIQGQGTLAGEQALSRVEAELSQKQAAANSSATTSSSANSGYTAVQNLMSSLDNITINNGNAPAPSMSSSAAASGYTAVQNLMTSLDNITINGSSSGSSLPPQGMDALQSVDAAIAAPPPVSVIA